MKLETLQASLHRFRDALEAELATFRPNATYDKAPSVNEYLKLKMVRGVLHSVSTGQRYLFLGESGVGKTSFIRWVTRILGIRMAFINAAQMSIENIQVPFPVKDGGRRFLRQVLDKQFISNGEPWLIYINEINRADPSLLNTLMEILQEGSIGGIELENLVTVIADGNRYGTYGRMAEMDFSQADRFVTVELNANDTPWRRALAEKYDTTDLSELFAYYRKLPAEVRRVLSPRVLDHMIDAVQFGFAPIYALPILNGQRQRLVRGEGEAAEDITVEVLSKVCETLKVTYRESNADILALTIRYVLERRQNVYLEGEPGMGKSAVVKAMVRQAGARYVYDSGSVLNPEDLSVPVPDEDGRSLRLLPMEKYIEEDPFVWVFDEFFRQSRRTANATMEPVQERTIGGESMKGLIATIAINNPPKTSTGMKLSVGKGDLAQATRFAVSVQLDPSDIPAIPYLLATYGEDVAAPFIEWWQDDIGDEGRSLVTMRCIERLIGLYLARDILPGVELEEGLPFLRERVGVNLVDLEARLSKRSSARLRQIVAAADTWAERLAAGEMVDAEAQAAVMYAFTQAEVVQLEAARDVCVRLYSLLSRQHQVAILRQKGERQVFWTKVVADARKLKAEAA
jgi:MoxR-like ATPase